jgi:transposase-like protein
MTQLLEFKNLKELMKYLSNESVCRAYVEQMRWPDGNVICPHCKGSKAYRYKDGKTFRCREKTCKKDFSLTTGTIFENTKIPLSTWLAALYVIASHKKGISSHQLARDLGITQKSTWFLNHHIGQMVTDKAPDLLQDHVMIDESHIGGRWANMPKTKRTALHEAGKDNKILIMGMVQQGSKAKLFIIGKIPHIITCKTKCSYKCSHSNR